MEAIPVVGAGVGGVEDVGEASREDREYFALTSFRLFMPHWSPGDRRRAICPHCESTREVEYRIVSMLFRVPDQCVLVPALLGGVCLSCDQVALIPAQSTPVIHEMLAKARQPQRSEATPEPADRPHGPIYSSSGRIISR